MDLKVFRRHIALPALGSIPASLRGRPDSEHEMSFNRLVFCLVIIAYLAFAGFGFTSPPMVLTICYAGTFFFVFMHILWRPQSSRVRRFLAMVGDLAAQSLLIHLGGEITSIFFPLLLWTVFGNGFRFGLDALMSATVVALIGFTGVVLTTPFWKEHVALSVGLWVGLLILP